MCMKTRKLLKRDEPVAKDASLNNQAQTVNCTVERHVSIQTKAHLEDGSQTFTHGDVVDMFDDVSITHDVRMAQKRLSKQFCMHYYRMVQTKKFGNQARLIMK